MHYYKRNLGDYAKKAGRLSILQHGVYNLLIDACYDREAFPTREEAVDWTWAASASEIEAVDFVLRKFFELVDGRYVQRRIAEEIAEYREKAERNKVIAGEREAAKREGKSTKRARNVEETQPNQEPRTKNQEPKDKREPVVGEEGGPDGPARADLENLQSPSGPVALAAQAMAAAGLADVSATHPKLLALVAAGITPAELADAAAAAVRGGRGFPWALARAEGQRRDAAQVGALPAAAGAIDPDSRAAIEADGVAFGFGKWSCTDDRGNSTPWAGYAAKVKAARARLAAGGVPA